MKWVDERKRARGPGDLPMAYSEVREPEAGVPVPAGRRSPLTVQDIIDRADVKRSTSLLPLKSKEDLLEGSVAMLAPRSRSSSSGRAPRRASPRSGSSASARNSSPTPTTTATRSRPRSASAAARSSRPTFAA